MDLSIPIPHHKKKQNNSLQNYKHQNRQDSVVNLEECLEKFIKEEDMEKCGYKCNKCKSEDEFKNQMTVWRYP